MGPYNPYNFGIPAYGYSQTPPVQPMQQEPSIKVPQVHGENGAKAYSLPPNSSILLMDENRFHYLGKDDRWSWISYFKRLSDCSNGCE